jgi:hypothetical protein
MAATNKNGLLSKIHATMLIQCKEKITPAQVKEA